MYSRRQEIVMAARPRRSVLYMPGTNPKAMAKARELPADAVVLDLEDSVAPDAKPGARARIVEEIKAGGFGAREVLIRVNGLHTPWGEADLEAAVAAAPDGVLLPKVDGPGTVMQAARLLRAAPEKTRLWAMMETPMAMLSAGAIAATAADSTSRLEALVLGLNDLAKETRARLTPGRAAFTPWLAVCVSAARAHGCDVIDGVYNDIVDLEGFRAECRQGLEFGFDGKTLIHPSQVEICNEIFAPTPAEVAHAKAVIEAFDRPENAGKGVLQIDGKMVELLHAQMAKRTLAIADAIGTLAA
jgi:citrate lyase subunit beta/citryl-CoA lyase